MPCQRLLMTFVFVLALLSGCDGAADKGKNKDRDIPKPAPTKVS